MTDPARAALPTWLVELQSQALKDDPSFSLSEEFRKVHGAKTRGEDPAKTIYNVSDEELEKLRITKAVQGPQLNAIGNRDGPVTHEEQRPSVDVESGDLHQNGGRDLSQHAKLQKRKALTHSLGDSLSMPRKASKVSGSIFAPTEAPFAESSKAGAARKPSSPLERPVASDWSAQVPKSEVETHYDVKVQSDWYVFPSLPT